MNVLITSTTFIPSVILCGHSQLDYLEKQGKLNYKFVIAHFINSQVINWADIIIFLRSDSDIEAYVSKLAKRIGKHQIYVLDDDLLNAPSYVSSFPYYNLTSTKNNIKTIMNNCDTFLTTSPVLLEKYGNYFENKFLINEPSLNRIDKKQKNKKIKVGFAGSIDRSLDLNQILEGTIERLASEYGNLIDIEFMGAKPEFIDKYGLTYLSYQDSYDAYTAFMAKCNWDIGLAPMPDTDFHRCKYFNKYVEYASFGIAGVYSNLKPYIYGIKDKVNGLLVNNTTEEWFNAIKELIDNKELREKISKECLKQASEIYSLDACAYDYYDKLIHGYSNKETKEEISSLEFIKFIIFFKRVYRKIKEQGLNFPNWLLEKINIKIKDKKEIINYKNDLEKINKIINNKKTIIIIAPYFEEKEDEYNKRVKYIDSKYCDYHRIYISGEDRLCEHLKAQIIDEDHSYIVFNSYDSNQTNEILDMINRSKKCLIHSVIRFMREKISSDMYKAFDLKDVEIIWDTHGKIPEKFHEKANYHTEMITNEIEKIFFEKSSTIICDSKELKDHFIEKYNNKDKNFVEL